MAMMRPRWRAVGSFKASQPATDPGACRHRQACLAISAKQVQVSLDLLQVSEVSGIVELKQAYHARIKRLHPDVNQHQDTTDEAAAVNAAYSTLCEVQALVAPGARGLTMKAGDVFDEAGPQTHWFANPLTLETEPLMWRELQDAIRGCFDRGLNTDDALLELRLRNPTSGAGIVWLTEKQRAEVELLMEECARTLAYDTTAWFLSDCLLRAGRAALRPSK